ncbi:MAG: hypothetical protein ACMXYD_04280 [Candidatus Woesearchaeota archaeon]
MILASNLGYFVYTVAEASQRIYMEISDGRPVSYQDTVLCEQVRILSSFYANYEFPAHNSSIVLDKLYSVQKPSRPFCLEEIPLRVDKVYRLADELATLN